MRADKLKRKLTEKIEKIITKTLAALRTYNNSETELTQKNYYLKTRKTNF